MPGHRPRYSQEEGKIEGQVLILAAFTIYLNVLGVWAGTGVQKEVLSESYFRNHFSTLHAGGTPVLNRIRAMKML
jgi:hypothetical protein